MMSVKRAVRILGVVLLSICLACLLIARSKTTFEFLEGKRPSGTRVLEDGRTFLIYNDSRSFSTFLPLAARELDRKCLTHNSDKNGELWILPSLFLRVEMGTWILDKATTRGYTFNKASDSGVTIIIQDWNGAPTLWNKIGALLGF
jgi:hypothetical protein